MDDGFGMEVDEMCNYSGYVENKGIEKGRTDIIESALKNKNTPEQVAAFLNIPLDEVQRVEKEMLQKA